MLIRFRWFSSQLIWLECQGSRSSPRPAISWTSSFSSAIQRVLKICETSHIFCDNLLKPTKAALGKRILSLARPSSPTWIYHLLAESRTYSFVKIVGSEICGKWMPKIVLKSQEKWISRFNLWSSADGWCSCLFLRSSCKLLSSHEWSTWEGEELVEIGFSSSTVQVVTVTKPASPPLQLSLWRVSLTCSDMYVWFKVIIYLFYTWVLKLFHSNKRVTKVHLGHGESLA